MRVEITQLTTWADVLNSARFTQRKTLLNRMTQPSDDFKKRIIRAEHSPLRCLVFFIDLYDIPRYVSDHLVRHVHAQPFVSTGRHDVLGSNPPREEQRMTDLYNTRLLCNAQEIINISKLRLCAKAESETRKLWHMVIDELAKTQPLLAAACVPSCIYRNICPEMKSCGFVNCTAFNAARNRYLNFEL